MKINEIITENFADGRNPQGMAENSFVNFMNKSLSTKVDKPPEDPLAHAPDFYKNAPVANARIRPAFLKALKFGLSVLAKLDTETKQELLERGEHAICAYIDSVAERTGATGFREEDVYECQDDLANIFHDPTMHSWVDVLQQDVNENFHDGKNPGRKGLAKRSGVNTKASVSSLRKTAKNSTGEKQRMAHWLANMKAGRAKAK